MIGTNRNTLPWSRAKTNQSGIPRRQVFRVQRTGCALIDRHNQFTVLGTPAFQDLTNLSRSLETGASIFCIPISLKNQSQGELYLARPSGPQLPFQLIADRLETLPERRRRR